MPMTELKQAFHELIERIDDEEYLRELYEGVAALHQRPAPDDDAVVVKLQRSLEKAQTDQGMAHEQFRREVKTGLSN